VIRPVNDPRRLSGRGFALPAIQHPAERLAGELQLSLGMGSARADRKLKTTASNRIYFGTALTGPQKFTVPPNGSVNTPLALEAAVVKAETTGRRAVGKHRASAGILDPLGGP
jgi:hypothetical protein